MKFEEGVDYTLGWWKATPGQGWTAQRLILVRGLPGSGKTSFVDEWMDTTYANHLETDMFFSMEPDGVYRYDPDKFYRAMRWTFDTLRVLLHQGKDVVFSNCNRKFTDARQYVDFAKRKEIDIHVYTMLKDYGSIHDVPESRMDRIRQGWESHETFMEKLIAYQPE